VCPDMKGNKPLNMRSEYPVDPEVLNSLVLAVIVFFGVCLYVAVVVTGLAELLSAKSTFGTGRKHSRNQGAPARRRNTRRPPHL
jgi:hypothetical protein